MHISIWLVNPEVKSLNFSESQKKLLEEALPDTVVSLHKDSVSFKESLKDTDIALVWVFNQKWLTLAPKLKWIATPSAGREFLSLNLPENIMITYGSFHGELIAETVLSAILGFSRGTLWAYKYHREFIWPRKEIEFHIKAFKGSHLVILGFGNIGECIAKLAKPFGVKITGIKRDLINSPDFFDMDDKITTVEELDAILPETDHLVLVLPRDKSTDNILDKRRLELLPSHAYIYNVGRGNAIDEIALTNLLKEGRIAGAYLDVFKKEPLDADSPLNNCPNILITPHSSARAPHFFDLFINEFVSRYEKWKKKEKIFF